jgi:CheY-like chemotaxis protein
MRLTMSRFSQLFQRLRKSPLVCCAYQLRREQQHAFETRKGQRRNRHRRDRAETIASFGEADLIRRQDGSWELIGGVPYDHAAAREWSSLFQHEATFVSDPLPVGTPQAGAVSRHCHRVLIADDDARVRGSLAAVLESEGFVVDEAQNGIETVTLAIQRSPDLVLLDLNMPHCDGWTAFNQLERVAPLVPVIVITARPNQYKEAVRLGVDAFMEKPLNMLPLVQAIKSLASEDESARVRRVTDPAFVTQLLDATHM